MKNLKLAVGSDHAGFKLKEAFMIVPTLKSQTTTIPSIFSPISSSGETSYDPAESRIPNQLNQILPHDLTRIVMDYLSPFFRLPPTTKMTTLPEKFNFGIAFFPCGRTRRHPSADSSGCAEEDPSKRPMFTVQR